jgi:hypothetical protein
VFRSADSPDLGRDTAIGGLIVALTGAAGIFVGHATAPKVTAEPQPTVTVTVLGPSDLSSPSDPSGPPTSAAANGTQVGSYSININAGHSIPLGPVKPTQAQFSTAGIGDLGTAAPADHLMFVPINGNKMLALDGGSTPSYQACAATTVFSHQADSTAGTSFCLIENGRIAGVMVTSVQTYYVVLHVTVWQNMV